MKKFKLNKATSNKLKKIKWQKVLIIVVSVVLVVIAAGGGYFAWTVYKNVEDFSAEKLLSGEASKVFDKDGNLVYTYGSDENGKRQNVTYEQLPQVLVDAVVAAEDSRYFEHDGFDLPRIVKTALTNLMKGRIAGGGSTITQQTIKKAYYPEEERTYTRKIGEIFLAMEATKEVSKEEILELYLNKIYFGRSISSIGIGAASNYYFNKDVSMLTLPEAALLAGTLNAPGIYDPYYNLEAATNRRSTVLKLMEEHGYITSKEKEAAEAIPVENMLCQPESSNSTALQSYIDLVTQEVEDRTGYDPRVVQMNIYTYLDVDLQQYCDDLGKGITYDYPDEYMDMGGAIQSTLDGRVVAVIGGRNYTAEGVSNATTKQQPGSSLKPIIAYGAAIEYLDWCSEHTVEDKPYNKGGHNVSNWDGQLHGKMVLSEALVNSWNLPAIWTLDEVISNVGSGEIVDMLERYGIDMEDEEYQGKSNMNPGYAIGGWMYGVTPQELAEAYATVANNGKNIESHAVNYIEIANSNETIKIDEQIQEDTTQAVSEETAFIIRQIMLKYSTSAGYSYFSGLSNVGAKTGTTTFSDNKYVADGKAKDIWCTAYNPDYCVSVWMGHTPEGIKEGYSMHSYMSIATPVTAKILKYIINRDGTNHSFPSQPSGAVQAQIVKGIYPYVTPMDGVPLDSVLTAWFKKGTTPSKTMDSIGINSLSSFDASLSNSGIHVNFSAYSPIEATTDENTNDATQIYGKVIYCVDIIDSNGKIVYNQKLSTNQGTINYIPKEKVNVVGYYAYEKSSTITSNKITKSVGEDKFSNHVTFNASVNGVAVSNGDTINATSLHVSVTPQKSDSKITITLIDTNGITSSETSANATFTLNAGMSYTLTITETSGANSAQSTIRFNTSNENSNP